MIPTVDPATTEQRKSEALRRMRARPVRDTRAEHAKLVVAIFLALESCEELAAEVKDHAWDLRRLARQIDFECDVNERGDAVSPPPK